MQRTGVTQAEILLAAEMQKAGDPRHMGEILVAQSEDKLYLLADGCGRRMKQLGTRTLRDYWDQLTAQPSRDLELRHLLNEITIGETYMFRNPAQLEALRNVILPQILHIKSFRPQTPSLLVRRLLDRRRAPHAGHVSARRKRQVARRLDLGNSRNRFER